MDLSPTVLEILTHKASCSFENAKKAFYRAFNGIFGKVGRVASENVVVELVKKKCLPVLIYGTEACAMSNAQIKSLNFAVICSFKKIFDVRSTDVAVECMKMFDCREMSDVIARRKLRFLQRYAQSESTVCMACNEQLVKDLSVCRHLCALYEH